MNESNQAGELEPKQGPLVTIAIPTYNRAGGFLPVVLEAALSQTWQNIEVLVGDNASTDETPDIVGAIEDERLVYFRHKENIGANGNFNDLLNRARGEWFLLLHDDDLIDHDFVESCLSVVEPGHQLGFICTGVRSIDADGNTLQSRENLILGPSREDFFLSWFRKKTALYLCSTLYHTERLREIGGFHSMHNLLEDNYALCKLLKKWRHGDIRAVKASYRYTFDQRTYSVPVVEWCQDFQRLLKMIVAETPHDSQTTIQYEGNRFFGRLCLLRADALSAAWKRLVARLQIAWYFGPQTLFHRRRQAG